jgi:biotin-(acetyl-CoA carboxylase) ligase
MQTPLSGSTGAAQRAEELPRRRHEAGLGSRVPTRSNTPARNGYNPAVLADWRKLTQGDSVVLLSSREEAVGGVVDEISADGSILWIHQDDCGGRRLFHRADGYKTYLDAPDHEDVQAANPKFESCLTE